MNRNQFADQLVSLVRQESIASGSTYHAIAIVFETQDGNIRGDMEMFTTFGPAVHLILGAFAVGMTLVSNYAQDMQEQAKQAVEVIHGPH